MSFLSNLGNAFVNGLGSIVGGLIGAGGNIFGANQGNKNALEQIDRQNKYNVELANMAFQHDVDMWNRQNVYNTPLEQMNRLKAAGLNPNLMYGQGNTGNASGAPSYDAPRMEAYTSFGDLGASAAANQLMNGLNSAAMINKINAETSQIRQNTVNLETQNRLAELQIISQGIANAKSEYERKTWFEMFNAKMADLDSSILEKRSRSQLYDSNRFFIDEQRQRFSALTPLVEQEYKVNIAQKLFDLNVKSPAQVRQIIASTEYQNKLSTLVDARSKLLDYELEYQGEANKYVSERAFNENVLKRLQVELHEAETDFRTYLREQGFDIGNYFLKSLSPFTNIVPTQTTLFNY